MTAPSSSDLPSNAERQAKRAESLPAFSGLSLLHIRRQVAHFLSLIGREGIFDQYTTHDISHIDKMLASLDWLIPEGTKAIMSPTDWLMTTLAIYFHDMGMLVTAREYDARNQSDFPRYRDEVLFAGPDGADYKAKVEALAPDRAERFLYQEWVRHKHAERIRAWIGGVHRPDLGSASEIFAQIDKLLEPLGPQFRRDLALICESHHLSDLNDLKKYKVSQPYGDSDAETANLQYCAVLLRTADLLHITSDRTPTAVFKTINPTDPLSQAEWAKQMAVKRLRPKTGLNEEGVPDEKAPKDTIEVHAYFTDPNGFFGLTSYLTYATGELRRSYDWVSAVRRANQAQHEFPWRRIDDSHIETQGFIRESFEFTIDQGKILDLLTGHTLYNDTRVVLRELVQNSLDAIRLSFYPEPPRDKGQVAIEWNSRDRTLIVRDNGTGMTQRDISDFLLRVGTSRYQDPEFKKKYPSFSSISRFGIGVLSTFMIADAVEITTCHPDDEQARQLTLRSVHGKYLIRLLDKRSPGIQSIYPHGTEFKLRVRPSVQIPDVVETAKLWIVIPQCHVAVRVDDRAPVAVGFDSVADALADILRSRGIASEIAGDNKAPELLAGAPVVRVFAARQNGVEVAFAVRWSEFFREWEFLTVPRVLRSEDDRLTLGTCVEGIRVETDSPGFSGTPIVALSTVSGSDAPKTNVARSGLEATPERDLMLRKIYGIYADHVAREAHELHADRSFSLTWAAEEARFLLRPLLHRSAEDGPISPRLLNDALSQLNALVVEQGGERRTISPHALAQSRHFWTIDSALLRSAEPLIREAGTSASLSRVISAMNLSEFTLPEGIILCGMHPDAPFGYFAYYGREVDQIIIHHEQRRVDLRWVDASAPARWLRLPESTRRDLTRQQRYRLTERRDIQRAWDLRVGAGPEPKSSREGEIAVSTFGEIYIFPDTSVAAFLRNWLSRPGASTTSEGAYSAVFVFDVVAQCLNIGGHIDNAEVFVKRTLRRAQADYLGPGIFESGSDLGDLVELVSNVNWRTFDPSAWRRQSGTMYADYADLEDL